MASHLLKVVFLFAYTAFINCNIELYITPSADSSCPQDPCLTLSQFTLDPSKYIGNKTNISLFFLPGNHTLERELSLYGANNFSIVSQDNKMVVIECASQTARFVVNKATIVSIRGLHFIGCGKSVQ